jgi:N-acetylneuraminic acid mutarotase
MVNGGHYDSVDDKWVAVPSERFDPTSSTWSKIADMGTSRGNPFVARLADGRILVAGGAVKVSMTTEGVRTTTLTKTAEIWDPATDTWTPTADMPDAREGGAATLLKDGSVLLAGGDLGEQGELFIPGGFPTKLIAAALRFYP